jgi:hypothetical protein
MNSKSFSKIIHLIGLFFITALIASCGGGSSTTTTSTTTTVINGISVPPEPDPVANNATLAGIDSNNNGVRDDVEIKMAKNNLNKIKTAQIAQKTITETGEESGKNMILLECGFGDSTPAEVESIKSYTYTRNNDTNAYLKSLDNMYKLSNKKSLELQNNGKQWISDCAYISGK